MIINVIDMDDSTTRPAANSIGAWNDRVLTAQATSTIIHMYGMSNGVAEMVKQVVAAASHGSIEVFRIWGHASGGSQNVSSESGGAAHWAGISVGNFESLRPELAKLTHLFAAGARAELRGCSVASGNAGERLLQLLATLWGVPVYGGSVTQRTAHSDWIPPVYCAEPNGSMSSSAGVSVR
jgi:hypothetical protein